MARRIAIERHHTQDRDLERVQDAMGASLMRLADSAVWSSQQAGREVIVGSFTTNGTAAVSSVSGSGIEVEKVPNLTGIYRVLTRPLADAVILGTIGRSAILNAIVQPKFTDPHRGLYELRTMTSTTATATNPTNATVWFVIVGVA